MNLHDLQFALASRGIYLGKIDGVWGPMTRAAILTAMTEGPDTRLTEQDFEDSGQRLALGADVIKAFATVESTGDGDADGDGRPDILFEGHRFSRATKHKYDASHPDISYPTWDRTKYPRGQDFRYQQLLRAVCLDVDAGFASASYGMFQILGENHELCGFSTPFFMAMSMAQDERSQLVAFERFVTARGVVGHLRRGDYQAAADIYNGPASRLNRYGEKIAFAVAHPKAWA